MGIQMNAPILYKHASLRYFAPNEHHIRRFCEDDVLLLVFDGILRFSEDGEEKEVKAGEYYIQKHGTFQDGAFASDSPRYFYVHFYGEHGTGTDALPLSGRYDITELRHLINALDRASHSGATYTEQMALFMQILVLLYTSPTADRSVADGVEAYLAEHCIEKITLADLSRRFGYSKNQIILLFKKQYGCTPVSYIRTLRLRKAKQLMESTSDSLQCIAEQCGFFDYSQFYKAFYQAEHRSPVAWRSEIRKTPTK